MDHGIDTIMGMHQMMKVMQDAIKITEDRCGKKMIVIDTPIINVDNNEAARREARSVIQKSKEAGSTFCFPHHSSVEQLVNKNQHKILGLDDYTDMIRQEGMIPGLSAHMPEIVLYSDENGYDVEIYIQLYNCMGFLMQVEVEGIVSIIHNAKKPVMTIKSMAAGRISLCGAEFFLEHIERLRYGNGRLFGCGGSLGGYQDLLCCLGTSFPPDRKAFQPQ